MSTIRFASLIGPSAREAGRYGMAGCRAEERSRRVSRIRSGLTLMAVIVAAFSALVAYREEMQFVAGDIASKFQTSSPKAAAREKPKLKVPDLQEPAAARVAEIKP